MLVLDYPYVDVESSFDWQSPKLLDRLAQHLVDGLLSQTSSVDYLVGVSLGATLALKMNELLGDAVQKIVLISSGGFPVPSFRKEMILQSIREQDGEDFLKLALSVDRGSFTESNFVKNFITPGPTVERYWHHYTQELWTDQKLKSQGPALISLMKASVEVDYGELIQKYQKKEVIIWGEQDKVFSMRFYNKFLAQAPGAGFHLLNKIGHFSPLETPETVAAIIEGLV